MRITKIAMLVIVLTLFSATSKAQYLRHPSHRKVMLVINPYVPSYINKHYHQKKQFTKVKKKPLHLVVRNKKVYVMKR